MVVKWHWNSRAFAASSELPEFLNKGTRRHMAREDFLELAGYPSILDSRGSRPHCLRESREEWLSFIGCSDYDTIEQGSSECDLEKEKIDD